MAPTATKSKSIILSADEVRAVQAGRKSQFRVVVKPQPANKTLLLRLREDGRRAVYESVDGSGVFSVIAPYRVGDLIAVKEPWGVGNWNADDIAIMYATDASASQWMHGKSEMSLAQISDFARQYGRESWKRSWVKSATQMPDWAVRHFLRVTAVNVERLQSISQQDAYFEGESSEECSRCNGTGVEQYGEYKGMGCEDCDGEGKRSCRKMFRDSWDSRHARKPDQQWAANPWVWAVAFTVEKAGVPNG